MRKLTLILTTLIFSLMFSSSTSFAEWTKVIEDVNDDTWYVDFERIRKHDGYVYFWELQDYSKPLLGNLSSKVYVQVDCKKFRSKMLSGSWHKEPMGGGTGKDEKPDKEWEYPPPDSVSETILKTVCQYAR